MLNLILLMKIINTNLEKRIDWKYTATEEIPSHITFFFYRLWLNINRYDYLRNVCTDGSRKLTVWWWFGLVVPLLLKLFEAKKPGNFSFVGLLFLKWKWK